MENRRVAWPAVQHLLAPMLPSLPAAALSTQPGPGILRLLSPILRQRVRLFSSSSREPWLRFLCYNTDKAAKLADVARSGDLDPHPVSGEVEVDWDYDVETRFRRLDVETLQALVVFKPLGLVFQLVYCVGDEEGGGDGWRVGEVSVPDKPSPFSTWGGMSSVADAEADFKEKEAAKKAAISHYSGGNNLGVNTLYAKAAPAENQDDEDEDDDYWARYDASPARTPAEKRSPAPSSMQQTTKPPSLAAEDAYFAQYDSIQPALDNYDREEVAATIGDAVPATLPATKHPAPATTELVSVAPPLGLSKVLGGQEEDPAATDTDETTRVWTMVERDTHSVSSNEDRIVDLVHPRPESSASSIGSQMVARLETSAGIKEQTEFGIKEHICRTIRSLFSLSRAAGVDRQEFEQLVRRELNILSMMEDEECV